MYKYEDIYIVGLSFSNNQAHISPYRSPFHITIGGDRFMHYMVTYWSFKINMVDTTTVSRLQASFKSNVATEREISISFQVLRPERSANILYFSSECSNNVVKNYKFYGKCIGSTLVTLVISE